MLMLSIYVCIYCMCAGSIPMSPSRLAETKINDHRTLTNLNPTDCMMKISLTDIGPSVTIEDTDSVSEPGLYNNYL